MTMTIILSIKPLNVSKLIILESNNLNYFLDKSA